MPKNSRILDTNILIRFLTNDTPTQAQDVEQLFKKSGVKSLVVPDIVVVETAFVLLSFYKLTKNEVIEKLSSLVIFEKFDINVSLFQKTLEFYRKYAFSFVDAYMAAQASLKESTLYTFDKRLLKIHEVNVVEP